MNASLFGLAMLLGLRHGMDPDHLAAIDGLTRVRNSPWNGVLFALGHGIVVTLLAVGAGRLSTVWIEQLSPLLLFAIGTLNLYRLLRRSAKHVGYRIATSSPVLLGIVFAAGFETASQLSALALAKPVNAWLLGGTFSLGMMIVDGIDGYNAFVVQSSGNRSSNRGERAARVLGFLVVAASYGLALAEWKKFDMDRLFLPIGISLFVFVLGLRIWSRLPGRAAKETRIVSTN
jgi:high-affinity nickel-transport protein